MKWNKIVMLLAVTLFCATGSAQNISKESVPEEVLSAFRAKFPTVSEVTWAKEGNSNYEANFKIDDKSQRAEFTKAGVWVESESSINKTQLPQKVTDAVMKESPTCQISDAEEIQTSEMGRIYEVGCMVKSKKTDYRVNERGQVEKKLMHKY